MNDPLVELVERDTGWPELTLKADMPIQISDAMRLRIARGEKVPAVRRVPLDMFDGRSELQCQRNHDQTLAVIRSRSGFDAIECMAVLTGVPYRDMGSITAETAHLMLYAMIVMFNRGQRVAERALSSQEASK